MSAFTVTLDDADALRTLFEQQLSKRRLFVQGAGGAEVGDKCEIVVAIGARSIRLAAEVVYVRAEDPGRGVGLQLPEDAEAAQTLREFVGAKDGDDDEPRDDHAGAPRLDERVRALTTVEQQRMAASGTLPERVALERLYGPNVWETLLRNQRITVPEVARIARKGTVPRPLVELIAANAAWIGVGEVQRALLSNPRSTAAVVQRVLGAMSRGELVRVPQQTAYPQTVRQAARKLLGKE